MADFTALTVGRVTDVTNASQLTKFCQQVQTILNGLIWNGQIQRTAQDRYQLGGSGVPLDVADGGTGDTTLTAHSVLIGEGTSPVAFAGPGTTGLPLVAAGASADPAFAVLGVVGGGTGRTTLTAKSLLLGNGTAAVSLLGTPAVDGEVLVSTPTGPSWAAALLLGGTATGTGEVILRGGTSGAIEIIPQDAAGTYNFNLPTTAGTAGQVLTSQAGGGSSMTWSDVQPLDATLTALAGLTITANSLVLGTGSDAFSVLSIGANTFPARSSAGNVVAKSVTDGVLTFMATPSSANLAAAVTDETGTGALVFANTPTVATPTLTGVVTASGGEIRSLTRTFALSSAADTSGPDGTGFTLLIREVAAIGATCLVLYENNQTPLIIGQLPAGTFVTGAPGAGQIQIKNKAANFGVDFRAGAAVGSSVLSVQQMTVDVD